MIVLEREESDSELIRVAHSTILARLLEEPEIYTVSFLYSTSSRAVLETLTFERILTTNNWYCLNKPNLSTIYVDPGDYSLR